MTYVQCMQYSSDDGVHLSQNIHLGFSLHCTGNERVSSEESFVLLNFTPEQQTVQEGLVAARNGVTFKCTSQKYGAPSKYLTTTFTILVPDMQKNRLGRRLFQPVSYILRHWYQSIMIHNLGTWAGVYQVECCIVY